MFTVLNLSRSSLLDVLFCKQNLSLAHPLSEVKYAQIFFQGSLNSKSLVGFHVYLSLLIIGGVSTVKSSLGVAFVYL